MTHPGYAFVVQCLPPAGGPVLIVGILGLRARKARRTARIGPTGGCFIPRRATALVSLDPADPRCPDCDGPVGTTATYCMHCGAEFAEASADAATSEGVSDPVSDSVSDPASDPVSDPVSEEESGRLLDPDGLADDALTVVVGVVAGAVVGLLALILFGISTQSWWALVPTLLAWVGTSAYLVRRRTVGRAFRLGCFAVAVLLLALPVIAFSDAVQGGSFAGRIVLFIGAEVAFGVVALVVAAFGIALGE